MARGNHVHRFKRHTYKSGSAVYFCTLPECTFKIDTKLSLGKANICNRCGKEFRIDEISIRQAKPHCNDCTKSKSKPHKPNGIVVQNMEREMAHDTVSNLRSRLSSAIETKAHADAGVDDKDI